MPTIVVVLGKKRIEEISEENGLNREERDMLLKILHKWDKVVDKSDKIKILESYIDCNCGGEESKRIIMALIQINREYNEKMAKKEVKRKIREDTAFHVRG